MSSYSSEYYRSFRESSRSSADRIVPLVIEFVSPGSVVDVGCGTGIWLEAFVSEGIIDVCGIDRPELQSQALDIRPEQFFGRDLNEPIVFDRAFDLVVSLEVAEHLPDAAADQYVESLTALGSVVLFSAAVPHQGGENHVNEQWPAYWVAKFSARGYRAVDCLRMQIWDSADVAWWYAQNLLIFVDNHHLDQYPRLHEVAKKSPPVPPALVHPGNYVHAHWDNRVLRAAAQLTALIPSGHCFILVDQEQFGAFDLPQERLPLRFSANGQSFAGPPPDDAAAIRILGQLKQIGASFCVFGWPAFWWLDHYAEFARHLRSRYQSLLENDHLIVFDMREPRRISLEGES
jgi:SAM-dependent methyltransferase